MRLSALVLSLIPALLLCVPLHAEPLNPLGKPDFEPGTAAAYYIWVDRDGLHLRTTTASRKHVFSGVITTNKQMSKVRAVLPDKRKALKDFGSLSQDRQTLKFRFQTDGGVDGFIVNFDKALQDQPLEIEFNLKIDDKQGRVVTQRIFIGSQKSNPDNTSFKLKLRKPKTR